MKYMKKILCLALACVMCSQICGVTGEAIETTTWRITDNPDLPPAESLHQWSDVLVSHDTAAKFSITRLPSGVTVNYRVVRSNNSADVREDRNFSGNVSGHVVSVVDGRTYKHIVKYVRYISDPSQVKGNIVH